MQLISVVFVTLLTSYMRISLLLGEVHIFSFICSEAVYDIRIKLKLVDDNIWYTLPLDCAVPDAR